MSVRLEPLYANLVPTELEYRLHSKYWSRRRHKPHDFTVEVIIDFSFYFPDFITCRDTAIAKLLRSNRYILKAVYHGIETTIEVPNADLIQKFREKVEERGRPYSIRYLMRFFKKDRDKIATQIAEYWSISKRLATAIANDIYDHLINGRPFRVVGWEVEQESVLDLSKVYDSILTPFEENYPADYDNFIREVLIGIDDIVRGWFSSGGLYWDYPVNGELAELDGGVELSQDCGVVIEPKDITIPDWFEDSFRITHVEYRKANAYDVEPPRIEYWTESLRSYLEEHQEEIKDLIWRAYVNNILRRVLQEVGLL
jgi:hypothetical protein